MKPPSSHSRETQDITRALRRAGRRALEMGLKTGTPVYVVENGKIVDLTKRKRAETKAQSTKLKGTKATSTKVQSTEAKSTKAKTTKTTKTTKPNPNHAPLHVNFIKYLRHTKTPEPNNTPSPQICKVLIRKLRQ